MPIISSLGALTYNKNSQSMLPGSGFWAAVNGGAPSLTVAPINADLVNCWSTGGYTLEFYAYYNSLTGQSSLAFGNYVQNFSTQWFFSVSSAGSVQFNWVGESNSSCFTNNNVITANTWYNIAITFSSAGGFTTIRMFVNGILTNIARPGTAFGSSVTVISRNYSISDGFIISSPQLYSGVQPAFIDELRVSNTTRYTSTYTLLPTMFTPDIYTQLLCHFTYDINGNPVTPVISDSSYNNYSIGNNLPIGLTPSVTISNTRYKF